MSSLLGSHARLVSSGLCAYVCVCVLKLYFFPHLPVFSFPSFFLSILPFLSQTCKGCRGYGQPSCGRSSLASSSPSKAGLLEQPFPANRNKNYLSRSCFLNNQFIISFSGFCPQFSVLSFLLLRSIKSFATPTGFPQFTDYPVIFYFIYLFRKCMGGHRARAAAKNCSPEPTHRYVFLDQQ